MWTQHPTGMPCARPSRVAPPRAAGLATTQMIALLLAVVHLDAPVALGAGSWQVITPNVAPRNCTQLGWDPQQVSVNSLPCPGPGPLPPATRLLRYLLQGIAVPPADRDSPRPPALSVTCGALNALLRPASSPTVGLPGAAQHGAYPPRSAAPPFTCARLGANKGFGWGWGRRVFQRGVPKSTIRCRPAAPNPPCTCL